MPDHRVTMHSKTAIHCNVVITAIFSHCAFLASPVFAGALMVREWTAGTVGVGSTRAWYLHLAPPRVAGEYDNAAGAVNKKRR